MIRESARKSLLHGPKHLVRKIVHTSAIEKFGFYKNEIFGFAKKGRLEHNIPLVRIV